MSEVYLVMATVLICGPVGFFADDVPALCADCGADIVHRPHAPAGSVKVCGACGVKRFGPNLRIQITEETAREVLLWQATTKGVQ